MYRILEVSEDCPTGFHLYGAGKKLWKCKDPEVIISGPAETGKTRTCLEKLDALMWKYPGAQAIIVRKTYKSLKTSVLATFEKKVLGGWTKDGLNSEKTSVKKVGGEHVSFYAYPNNSRIYLGGMDDPGKILSSEWDIVYINQAEELTLNDWEIITTRTTGRAGNMPYAQVMADCNPGAPQHWILERAKSGKLIMLESRHEDNPVLFNPKTHQITEQGKRSLAVLDNLTGVRYLRLRKGKWAAAEGMIYEEFDRAIHIIKPFEIPPEWPRFRGIDFGYTNPFVCKWYAMDDDGRLYMYREIYMSKRLVEDHARQINMLSEGENIYTTVADHDAEDRATLEKYGIPTIAAMKGVIPGIQGVQSRLRLAGDGKPRLFYFSGALVEGDPSLAAARKPQCSEDEFESYIWMPTKEGAKTEKEAPLKENDHGMDVDRYIIAYVDKITVGDQDQQMIYIVNDDYQI